MDTAQILHYMGLDFDTLQSCIMFRQDMAMVA